MFHWRPYQPSIDLKTLQEWKKSYEGFNISEDDIPEESSFLFFWNNEPIYFISVILTNIKDFCFLENFIRNPKVPSNEECLHKGGAITFKYIKNKGYKHYLTTLSSPKLLGYYNKVFGMSLIQQNLLLAGGKV